MTPPNTIQRQPVFLAILATLCLLGLSGQTRSTLLSPSLAEAKISPAAAMRLALNPLPPTGESDPLLTPLLLGPETGANDFRISDMGPDGATNIFALDPAIAYNSTNNEYLVVWAGDDAVDNAFEIYGQRINASTGAEVGTNDFRISDMGSLDSDTNFRADTPAVAYDSANNEYLVVWRGDDNTAPLVDDELEIFGQRLNAATGAEVGTNDFRISDLGPDGDFLFNAFDPAVTYNSTNNEYLVVWWGDDTTNNANEIYGQRLNAASGAEVGSNDVRLSDMGANDTDTTFRAQNPTLAYNSANNEYLVVWEGDDDTAPLVDDKFEIYGQRLNAASGAEVGSNDVRLSEMGPDGNINFGAGFPDVAYNSADNEYLVVWHGDDALDFTEEVYGQRVNGASGAEVGSNDFRISDMGANDIDTNFRAFGTAVAYNSHNNSYLVVWRSDDDTDFGAGPLVNDELEIFGQELDATGVETGDNDFRLSDMGPDGNTNFSADKPDIAYSANANEFLGVWQGDDNVVTVDDEVEIFGQRLQPAPDAISPTTPVLIAPTGGITVTTAQPACDWTDATDNVGVISYTLILTNSSGSLILQASSSITSTTSSFTPTVDLPNSVYTWTVTAHDAAGNISAPASPANFVINVQIAYLPLILK